MFRAFLLTSTIFWMSLTLFGQSGEVVKSYSIVHAIHRDHVGEIAFMGKAIPIEQFQSSDFLTSINLSDQRDLNMRVFLATSLTNSLHKLAPELSAEALVQKGNFQITFWVDEVQTYVENLQFGAGSVASKNRQTVLRVPLISSTNEDAWGRFLWNRFVTNGGQDAFSVGEHVMRIEFRPYIMLDSLVVGNVIAQGELKIVVADRIVKEKEVRIQQIKPLKDWEISDATFAVEKIEALNRKIANETYKNTSSIVVIKEGKLLIEAYFNGAKRNTLHDTRSVGKSITSTLMGIALQDGCIQSEHQTLSDFYSLKNYQHYAQEKEEISLRSLLTMSSVFDGSDMNDDSPGHEEKMYAAKNWVDFTLNLAIDSTKLNAHRWDYFTAGVVLLGDVLHQSVPNGLAHYAATKLFDPMGISRYKWQFTPQKVVNTAGSLQMRSLDYAKLGQLYSNQGAWNGQQILSKDWINKSLTHAVKIAENEYYGYLFWNKTYHVNGKEYEVYYCSGNGGNRIFIFKDEPIVVVITSTAYNTTYGNKNADKMMELEIIPAIFNE